MSSSAGSASKRKAETSAETLHSSSVGSSGSSSATIGASSAAAGGAGSAAAKPDAAKRARSDGTAGGSEPSPELKKRLMREIRDLLKEPDASFGAAPRPGNITVWDAHIHGPKDTPYEGGYFELLVNFPDEYPHKAPQMKFLTRCYHPNIDGQGGICINILKDEWSPAFTVLAVLRSLSALLAAPNPEDPLVMSIAQEFKNNRKAFEAKARECTRLHATKGKAKGEGGGKGGSGDDDDAAAAGGAGARPKPRGGKGRAAAADDDDDDDDDEDEDDSDDDDHDDDGAGRGGRSSSSSTGRGGSKGARGGRGRGRGRGASSK